MDWARDLPGWPHAAHSRRVAHPPHRWHVQEMGEGETLLLIHGAGGSTHSWRGLMPLLARRRHVVALDLPGQGFTQAGTKSRCSLPLMSDDIAALTEAQGWRPVAVIGHSAGAAIALELARRLAPQPRVVGLNAALGNFEGVAGWLFPMLAKALALNPLSATMLTLGGASPARTRRLIESTGSTLDDAGLRLYARLVGDRGHVDATLKMMSQWRIDPLLDMLPTIDAPTLFVTGDSDTAVPPATSDRAAARMPQAEVRHLPGLGHLAHEEDPQAAAAEIEAFLT
ncbi:alpha/beta fold hydrolase [Rhodosalinus sediminis]|uniref:Alpha/beta fold hydrolase n=1 Tax=Rhodosalinus sediminis TaxID=1940533 RepID=A0A3D9BWN3_9RHOB|nr:alpha/beta fold hydrolase BchO [Rhodosalinus sediminis]REC57822.1 alpha/beta fold hydrolase [Rhodosalinus sediminis]